MPAPVIEGPCGECRRGDHAFDFARSVFLFTEPMRGILHHLKSSGRVSLAGPLGRSIRELTAQEGFRGTIAIPVPLHKSRQRERGFNQAELLARRLGLPVDVAPHLTEQTLAFVASDKKRAGDDVRYVLPGAPGDIELRSLPIADVVRWLQT